MCIFCLDRLCFGVLAATLNNATAITRDHFETFTSWETVEYLTATHTLRLLSSLSCVNTPLDPSLTPTPAMDASLRNAKGLHDELGALQANLLRRFTNLVNLAEVSSFSSQPHLISIIHLADTVRSRSNTTLAAFRQSRNIKFKQRQQLWCANLFSFSFFLFKLKLLPNRFLCGTVD